MHFREHGERDSIARHPRVVLSVTDHHRLEAIALEALLKAPRSAGALLGELDRADVVEDTLVDEGFVTLGDVVSYRDGATGRRRTGRLVERLADPPEPNSFSVLSSLGAALLGLHVGQSILWSDRLGADHVYTVLSVARSRTSRRTRADRTSA